MRTSTSVAAALGLSVAAVVIAVAPIALLSSYAGSLRPQRQSAASLQGTSALPGKWAAKYLLPQYFQENRGTCWSFATVGWLEQSYRQHGVEKGWLQPDEYVRLSNQAFALSVIDACRGHPDVCDALGEGPWVNHTAGGETWWLWSLTDLYTRVLPDAVCPYLPEDEQEHECPARQQAMAVNPLRFSVREMQTAYNPREAKALMVARDRPVLWSSMMHINVYYVPCNDPAWQSKPGCSEASRVRCPSDRNYGSVWCARSESAMYNQDGEFTMHGNVFVEGGHAMNAVGYNDDFVTKAGNRGGFIIKNSWHDLTYANDIAGRGARGSHSVAYWMQEISAWDEKALCPGPLNPDNWLSCVYQTPGPTSAGVSSRHVVPERRASTVQDRPGAEPEIPAIDNTCLSENFMQYLVKLTLQPTEFRCVNSEWCSQDPRYRYFLLNTERTPEQDLQRVCMLQYDTTTKTQATLCSPYANPSLIAYMYEPVKWQVDKLQNDNDFCGYYFWSYDLAYRQGGMWGSGQNYVTYFDLVWDDMSYAANAAKYPSKDYTLVKQSTHKQRTVDFGGLPSPWPQRRYN